MNVTQNPREPSRGVERDPGQAGLMQGPLCKLGGGDALLCLCELQIPTCCGARGAAEQSTGAGTLPGCTGAAQGLHRACPPLCFLLLSVQGAQIQQHFQGVSNLRHSALQ